jgi:hypothetical protein
VRSALRRQPGSPVFREFPSLDEKGPLNAGFSHRYSLWRPMFELFWPRIPKSRQLNPRKLPFSEDSSWRPKNKSTAYQTRQSVSDSAAPSYGVAAKLRTTTPMSVPCWHFSDMLTLPATSAVGDIAEGAFPVAMSPLTQPRHFGWFTLRKRIAARTTFCSVFDVQHQSQMRSE